MNYINRRHVRVTEGTLFGRYIDLHMAELPHPKPPKNHILVWWGLFCVNLGEEIRSSRVSG